MVGYGKVDLPFSSSVSEEFITDDRFWTEGNLQLISSDHIRFRVPPYYLFANSGVFRDMSEGGKESPIHFTDPNVESSTALRDVLQFLTNWELPADLAGSLNTANGELVMRAVWLHQFLTKYDCAGPLKSLEYAISEKRRNKKLTEMCDFLFCSNVGDKEGCNKCTIDGNEISYHMFRHIPPAYFWALLQTSMTLEKSSSSSSVFEGHVAVAEASAVNRSGEDNESRNGDDIKSETE